MRTAEEEWGGIDPKKVALLQDLIAAAREQGRWEAVQECAKRALNLYIAPAPRSKAAQFHERNVKAIIHDELLKLLPNKEG